MNQYTPLIVSLRTTYNNFSASGKAVFRSAYDAVVAHVRNGDIESAKLAIQMVVIPSEVPGVSAAELATLPQKKDDLLSLFP